MVEKEEYIPVSSLKVISEEDYLKLSDEERRMSDLQTLMARSHAMSNVIGGYIQRQKLGVPIETIKSSDLTKKDRAAHRKFARETGDYIT